MLTYLKFAYNWLKTKLHSATLAILRITTNPYVWVQWCHFSIATITFLIAHILHANLYIVAAGFMPATAYKELWIDPHDEQHTSGLPSTTNGKAPVGKPDWDDLTFYWLGMLLTLLFLHFVHAC